MIQLLLFASFAAAAPKPGADAVPQPSWHALPWLNAARPLAAPDLRGRLVLIDFVRAGRAADLSDHDTARQLWSNYPDALLPVLAANEGTRDSLRRALGRHGIQSPLVMDDGRLAKAYGVKPPATVLLDWDGRVAHRGEGARRLEGLPEAVSRLAAALPPPTARPELALKAEPGPPPGPLAYPGAVLIDENGKRLFVSDSGHRRVVVAGLGGRVQYIIGSGRHGDEDGPFETACFQNPQGLAVWKDYLFIADAGGHRVRVANLKSRLVSTLWSPPSLRAPWALALVDDKLRVAAAGGRQVWTQGNKGALEPFAGSGEDGGGDGPLAKASFAEPRALLLHGRKLLVADGGDALRELDLESYEVRSFAKGLNGAAALGLKEGKIFAADSAGRVLSVDPATGASAPVAEGFLDPAGLAALEGKLLVADAGAHALFTLSNDGRREPFILKGLKTSPAGPAPAPLPESAAVTLPYAKVRAAAPTEIRLSLELPPGWALNPAAPFRYRVSETRGVISYDSATRKGTLAEPKFPISLRFTAPPGKSETLLVVSVQMFHKGKTGLARAKLLTYTVPIEALAGEKNRVVPVAAAVSLD